MAENVSRLRLRANDLNDLTVIATTLQDALVPLADMRFEAKDGQFLLVANRYRWEENAARERALSGLRFDHVTQAQARGLEQDKRDRILSLLTISYDCPEEGGGHVVLHFSGGGAIRLSVEKLACALEDLCDPWPTAWRPEHQD